MNFQLKVMVVTAGLLTCPDDVLEQALALCAGSLDAERLYRSERPRVAVRTPVATRPLAEWIAETREAGFVSCRPCFAGPAEAAHDAHMMAGFLGGRPCSLAVTTARGSNIYDAGTVSSPRHAMSLAAFADLINSQPDPTFFWERILADINQFHRCNDLKEVETHELGIFLASAAGAHAWEWIGSDLMREVQVEALTFGIDFVVPERFADQLEAVEPWHENIPWVPLSAYDDDEVTGANLRDLVLAQDFSETIWQQCSTYDPLSAALDDEDSAALDDEHDEHEEDDEGDENDDDEDDMAPFPRLEAQAWPAYLGRLDEAGATGLIDVLLSLISRECEARGCDPVIPENLADIFGPDEEDRRRTGFRMRLQQDLGWRLAPQATRWIMYVFDEFPSSGNASTWMDGKERQRFTAALDAIAAFANKIDSPFAPAFNLAKRMSAYATDDTTVFPQDLAKWSAAHHPDVRVLEMIEPFARFGWQARRVFGLAAVSAADVFGAMGSWNDQSFQGDLNHEFETVSSALYAATNAYSAALLTFEPPPSQNNVFSLVTHFARQRWRRMLA